MEQDPTHHRRHAALVFVSMLVACGPIAEDVPPPGSVDVVVPATTDWVNTGVYLREGNVFTLEASGAWSAWPGAYPQTGPEGFPTVEYYECPFQGLAGSIGLHYDDPLLCIGPGRELTAPRDGILYLSCNDGRRDDNLGEVAVTIDVDHFIATPSVPASEITSTDWDAVTADMVELVGDHVILATPTDLVRAHVEDAPQSLAMFDTWWSSHLELSGRAPFGGDRIRFVPDDQVRDVGAWMLSGNPVRVDPDAIADPDTGSHFLLAHDARRSAWGFVHEMGHDFSFVNKGRYMIGPGPTEAWANLWSKYTLAAVGYPEASRTECDEVDEHLVHGSWPDLEADSWLPLCMLMEIHARHGGWPLFERFFRDYNRTPLQEIPDSDAPVEARWAFVRDRLNEAAGADVTPILLRYHVPLP